MDEATSPCSCRAERDSSPRPLPQILILTEYQEAIPAKPGESEYKKSGTARECQHKKHADRLSSGLLSGTFPSCEHFWLIPLFHPDSRHRSGKICRSPSRLYCRNSAAEQEGQSVQTDQSIRPASPSAKCDNARSIHQKYEGANRSCSDEEFGSPRRAAVDPQRPGSSGISLSVLKSGAAK